MSLALAVACRWGWALGSIISLSGIWIQLKKKKKKSWLSVQQVSQKSLWISLLMASCFAPPIRVCILVKTIASIASKIESEKLVGVKCYCYWYGSCDTLTNNDAAAYTNSKDNHVQHAHKIRKSGETCNSSACCLIQNPLLAKNNNNKDKGTCVLSIIKSFLLRRILRRKKEIWCDITLSQREFICIILIMWWSLRLNYIIVEFC